MSPGELALCMACSVGAGEGAPVDGTTDEEDEMRNLWYKLDAEHKPVPCTAPEAVDWNDERQRVGFTRLPGAEVSTVFLGLDHQFGEGPPVLFETMIFGGPLDQEQWRYHTWEEAVAGHRAAVRMAWRVLLRALWRWVRGEKE